MPPVFMKKDREPFLCLFCVLKYNLQNKNKAYPRKTKQSRNKRSYGIYAYVNTQNGAEKVYKIKHETADNTVCNKAHSKFYGLEKYFRNNKKNEQPQNVPYRTCKTNQENHPQSFFYIILSARGEYEKEMA